MGVVGEVYRSQMTKRRRSRASVHQNRIIGNGTRFFRKCLQESRSKIDLRQLGESKENLEIMKFLDSYHMEHLTTGVLGMQDMLKYEGINTSMDGKRKIKDNIWIERFWKTIKQEHIYHNPADNGLELYFGIKDYINFYNYKRAHQGTGRVRPVEKYQNAA